MDKMNLINQIKACNLCDESLPLGARPTIQASGVAKILISGQAPSLRVHQTGKLFNDQSGDALRAWLGVTEAQFYNPSLFAIVPMAFCYPGRGKSGDLPPPKICAKTWQPALSSYFNNVSLHILVGQYAQRYFCKGFKSVTQQVKLWDEMLPNRVALPHPSPRNQPWQAKNPWFKAELLPELKVQIKTLIDS
ncbi:uracil-DNA glycosylase family protein [Pseudoalteromonas phenolica]|uniref:uracil-DNA glycosylase family protein n=1 Tax=Pseudoalteromonas phenolica TaxID=161398 RepID=UPI00384FF96B